MTYIVVTLHVLICLLLIVVVLLQSGRGGGIGAGLAAASSQVFGGHGANVFLSRTTSILGILFFLTSMTLSMMSSQHRSVLSGTLQEPQPEGESTQPPNADEPPPSAIDQNAPVTAPQPTPDATPSPTP